MLYGWHRSASVDGGCLCRMRAEELQTAVARHNGYNSSTAAASKAQPITRAKPLTELIAPAT
jgi:hypothetical protein